MGGSESLLARIQDVFIERAPPAAEHPSLPVDRSTAPTSDVELGVIGLSAGCGATTVAIGLALALAEAGRDGNLIALGGRKAGAGGVPARLGPLRVWEVPEALRTPSEIGQYGGIVTRIAGGRGMGPSPTATVWDLGAQRASDGVEAICDVDKVVIVAHGDSDPALAQLAADMVAERHAHTVLVADRASPEASWQGRARLLVPDSRFGARQIARGRLTSGSMSEAFRELAALMQVEQR